MVHTPGWTPWVDPVAAWCLWLAPPGWTLRLLDALTPVVDSIGWFNWLVHVVGSIGCFCGWFCSWCMYLVQLVGSCGWFMWLVPLVGSIGWFHGFVWLIVWLVHVVGSNWLVHVVGSIGWFHLVHVLDSMGWVQ